MSMISAQLFHTIFGSGDTDRPAGHIYAQPTDTRVIIALSRTLQPRTVIEIGIQRGRTASLLLANGPWIQHYIGIDVPPTFQPALSDQRSEVPPRAGDLCATDPRLQIIIRPNGTADLTPAELPQADLIFIDGDHSAAGVTRDTALARAVIRPGGLLLWHDYNNHGVQVTGVIDQFNRAEGDSICLVEGSWMCFQFIRASERQPSQPLT